MTLNVHEAWNTWNAAYAKLLDTLPEIGSVLVVENGNPPLIQHITERDQDLLCAFAVLSSRMFNEDGSLLLPKWALMGEKADEKRPLKIIITGPSKECYQRFSKEDGGIKIDGVKITKHAHSKKSVLGEFIIE